MERDKKQKQEQEWIQGGFDRFLEELKKSKSTTKKEIKINKKKK